jgi:hypothetical protein
MVEYRVVQKRFVADGRQVDIGEIVECSEWRNRAALIRARYLSEQPVEAPKAPASRRKAAAGAPSGG